MSEIQPSASQPVLPPTPPSAPHDPYAALRFRDFRLLGLAQFIAVLGEQMISVAIGWELYERTNSAFALGLVGLVQVFPVLLLSLLAGQMADRFDRRWIAIISRLMLALCSLGLAFLSATQGPLVLIYGCLFLLGVARAFGDPAGAALLSQTVPLEAFTNAATWESSTWQLAAVIGPALGGLVIALRGSATLVFELNIVAGFLCVLLLLAMRSRRVIAPPSAEEAGLASLSAGVRFVWRTKVLLAAITLDLFAVLLGGATALMPIFARDILHVGPTGLGWLQTAPSVGAVLMSISLAYLPPLRKAGATLLFAVAGFGVATIVFGLSRWFPLSLAMLCLLGALDNISVIIRGTLLLTETPDSMRGRVSAVNSVFIGASNQLGGFESGFAAALLGPTVAVVAGGFGTILVVTAVALLWPQMRRFGRLGETLAAQEGIPAVTEIV